MNTKLKHYVDQATYTTAIISVFALIIAAGFLSVDYVVSDNTTDINNTVNESVLNQSKYLDEEDKVCRSPEINQSNVSQLKACIVNQTS